MSTQAIGMIELPAVARDATPADQFRALLRYAVLAPSSHNSQPWQFEIAGERLRIFADPSRWLRVADADQRELYLSVGCALENLLIAAEHFGLAPRVSYFPEGETADLVAEVHPEPGSRPPDLLRAPLFSAIAARHTNHREYDGRPLADEEIDALEGMAGEDGIQITSRRTRRCGSRSKVSWCVPTPCSSPIPAGGRSWPGGWRRGCSGRDG